MRGRVALLHRVVEADEVFGDQPERRSTCRFAVRFVRGFQVSIDDHVVGGGDRQRFCVFAVHVDVSTARVVFGVGVERRVGRDRAGFGFRVFDVEDAIAGEVLYRRGLTRFRDFHRVRRARFQFDFGTPFEVGFGGFEDFLICWRRQDRSGRFGVGADDVRRVGAPRRRVVAPVHGDFVVVPFAPEFRRAAVFRAGRGGVVRVHRAVDFVGRRELDHRAGCRESSVHPFFVVVFADAGGFAEVDRVLDLVVALVDVLGEAGVRERRDDLSRHRVGTFGGGAGREDAERPVSRSFRLEDARLLAAFASC